MNKLTIEKRITSLSEFGQAAIHYARIGWCVLPCRPRGKEAITPEGFYDATTALEVICDWWEKYPNANVAIRTGPESGIWVLDIDRRKNGHITIEALQEEHGKLPDSPLMVQTHDGVHVYYSYPEDGELGSRTPFKPGLDAKANLAYVMAPPSIHPEGSRYEWIT